MFTDEDRQIFPYHDGAKKVFGDPVEIQRRMNAALEGDVNGVVEKSNEFREDIGEDGQPLIVRLVSPQMALDYREKLNAAICSAFRLAPFDPATGQGMTSAMLLKVWNAFTDWMEQKKSPPVS